MFVGSHTRITVAQKNSLSATQMNTFYINVRLVGVAAAKPVATRQQQTIGEAAFLMNCSLTPEVKANNGHPRLSPHSPKARANRRRGAICNPSFTILVASPLISFGFPATQNCSCTIKVMSGSQIAPWYVVVLRTARSIEAPFLVSRVRGMRMGVCVHATSRLMSY